MPTGTNKSGPRTQVDILDKPLAQAIVQVLMDSPGPLTTRQVHANLTDAGTFRGEVSVRNTLHDLRNFGHVNGVDVYVAGKGSRGRSILWSLI